MSLVLKSSYKAKGSVHDPRTTGQAQGPLQTGTRLSLSDPKCVERHARVAGRRCGATWPVGQLLSGRAEAVNNAPHRINPDHCHYVHE